MTDAESDPPSLIVLPQDAAVELAERSEHVAEIEEFDEAAKAPESALVPDDSPQTPRSWWKHFFHTMGPGMVVMLADTDAGCLITAAQTGAAMGFSIIPVQLILIPALYMAQELTVRLGVLTRQGHGELIRDHFGKVWAWISVVPLIVACIGALITEMSGVIGIGEMYGLQPWVCCLLLGLFLMLIVLTSSYSTVEKIALVIGAFELVYIVTMFYSPAPAKEFWSSVVSFPVQNNYYRFLVAANIGAVVMPWMIFYQQSAVVDKGLQPQDLKFERIDTLVGSFITQLIMCAVIITTGSSMWSSSLPQDGSTYLPPECRDGGNETLMVDVGDLSVGDFSCALVARMGPGAGRTLYSLGLAGGSIIGSIVVTLTAAWGLGEVTGYKRSLSSRPQNAPWFFVVYGSCILIGAIVPLAAGSDALIKISLLVQVISIPSLVPGNLSLHPLLPPLQVVNAMLLPMVLGFLWMLALRALPDDHRLKGWYKWVSGAVFGVVSGMGVIFGILGLIDGA